MSVGDIPSYSFRVELSNIPDGLRGVTLPIEVFGPDGHRQWAAVSLGESASTIVRVAQPGKHDLRVELPSGYRIRSAVLVSPKTIEPETVHLDLDVMGRSKTGASETIDPGPSPVAVNKRPPDHLSFGVTAEPTLLRGAPVDSRQAMVECTGRLFDAWNTSTANAPEDLRLNCQKVVPSFLVPLGRETRLEEHPGWSANSRRGRPMLLHVRHPALRTAESGGDALVVLPPASRFPRVNFLLDPDPHPDPDAPHLLAYVESVRPAADALFTYVRGGSFEAARHAQATVKQQAEDLLYGKESSPVCAMVAAYALYRLGDRDRLNWLKNLADWFESMPDGAVVYGAYMILEARPEESWKYLKIALDRGIPMYSEGLKLLCDGLVLLRNFLARDAEVHAYAERAYSLAALANMDSELTCLRLDSKLQMTS